MANHYPRIESTAKIDIFTQIAPFRRTGDAALRNIDENGALPYKPRELSAISRSDRGRLIGAGERPVLGRPASPDLSHYQANCPVSGEPRVKRPTQPSKLLRKRRHGFRARLAPTGGAKVLAPPPARGRKRLSA